MAVKRYISKTGVNYTFLVEVKGKTKSISFRGNEKDCIINDPATQKAVENHPYFKNKCIDVAPGSTAGGFDEDVDGLAGKEKVEDKLHVARSNSKTKAEQLAASNKGNDDEDTGEGDNGSNNDQDTGAGEPTVYDKVTTPSEAREILMSEPYNLAPQSVQKNPESILKRAAELGVSFPNLKVE